MNYKFNTETHYNKRYLNMEFEGEYEALSYIFDETVLAYDNKQDWLNAINNTISGELQNSDFGVQSGFAADVGKEKTIIYCNFADEEVEISTEQFKKLSEIWFNKLEEFNETRKLQ
ncbi:hypothetical protein NRP93_001221 [Clostridium botulinum]|nr:hypothetical protein [Clostridium botulinum]